MAKRDRLRKEVDMISRLPDELLCHIISFLPLKEAICTSILSTRWSMIFTLISNLIFEDCFKKRKSESYSYMNFVDRVLFYHNGVVDKFRLKCGELIDPNKVDGWIRYALKNSVRELDLCLNCKEFKMPIWVFTCKTLVSLRLDILSKCKFTLKLPLKISLPSLKSLHLFGIQFSDDDSIQRLFSSCSVLEELIVDRCVLTKQCKFNVSSPTLKRLTIAYNGGANEHYEILIDAPSLVYFKWHCSLPNRFLLPLLAHELKLPLKIYSPSLKSLHLFRIQFPDDDSIQRLFSSCSVLEELVVDRCILKRKCKFNVSSPTLKRLTIAYIGGAYKDYEILIDAPSLVYFKWHCSLQKRFLLKNLNSLAKACIDCGTLFDSYEYFVAHNTAATELFNGIRNIQSLHLSGFFDEKLFLEERSIIPEFPNLTYLKFNGYSFVGWERVLQHLLACFPCLEALVFKVNLHHQFLSDASIITLPSNRFPSFLWSQLKTLKFLSFEGKKNELQMAEYFLKNAKVLENFIVQTIARRKRKPEKWRSKITKTLLNLPKVSEKCKVLVV
ncbi:hypothetical protein REPUB_Repub05bG0036300 [Reevesia pubescens]